MERTFTDRHAYVDRLDEQARRRLLAMGTARTYESGDVLLHEDDTSRHVLLVREGYLKITLSAGNGRRILLALRGPGSVVGELAAIDGRPRLARVTAADAVRAVSIPADDFVCYLRDTPGAALALLGTVADRLRTSDHRRLDAAAHTVQRRLALLLLDLSPDHREVSPVRPIPLSQSELADHLGTSLRSVARALERLRADGAVATRRRGITVLSREALTDAAYDDGDPHRPFRPSRPSRLSRPRTRHLS
ncbi:Crp/Fnr family transcriptional regulator [Streptomyces sp. NPDC053048]|uniref:Crp/Fnr family transcriptional regulator n=1 Tax=Streptomyces sp. NPDC053048 TaxID=3365694 RepID=UPI0037D1B3FE